MQSLVESGIDALSKRVACLQASDLFTALEKGSWNRLWNLSALPGWRVATMFENRYNDVYMVKAASLKNLRPRGFVQAYLVGEFDQNDEGVMKFGFFQQRESVTLLPNPLAFEVVRRDEPARLKKLSEDDLKATVGDGITVVHYAAALGAVECLAVLMRRLRVKVDCKLLYCCDARFNFGNRQAVLNLLLEQGDLDAREHSRGFQSLLESASEFDQPWMQDWVLNFDDDDDTSTLVLDDALIAAARTGQTDTARALIKRGANVNAGTHCDLNPLLIASMNSNADMIQLLVEEGADVRHPDEYGYTALMHACAQGDLNLVRLLLDHGADVNAVDWNKETALSRATKGKSFRAHIAVMKLLLKAGAETDVKDDKGVTSLMIASSYGDIKACRLLQENGADVNAVNAKKETALMLATMIVTPSHLGVMKFLLKNGADANAKDGASATFVRVTFCTEKGRTAWSIAYSAKNRKSRRNRTNLLESYMRQKKT